MTSQELTQRPPDQQLIARVREPLTREQLQMALPPTVTVDRFIRVMTSAIMANPDIAKLDHTSVLRAMVQSAAMGLIPDGKQAAITARKGEAVLVPMIQGFRDIAADHGWTLRTAVVYENDEFDHAVVDGEESITHRPVRPGAERGQLIAAYAIAKHRDGRRMLTVLHPDDIAKRRASSSYDAVWNAHPAAMWEKSAGRDLFAQLGFGELDERVSRILEASDTEPAEAARLMYGQPRTETPAALPARTGTSDTDETATSPPTQAEQSTAGASQQAATAATSPAAVAAPGAPDDEPALDEASPFQPPPAAEEDPIVAAGLAASQFQIPNGQHKGIPLAELLQKGDKGTSWLRWALRKGDELTPLEYRTAVWAFARVYAPDAYQEVLAEHEARS